MDILTANEVAEILRVSVGTARRDWEKMGGVRIGSKYRISREALERFLKVSPLTDDVPHPPEPEGRVHAGPSGQPPRLPRQGSPTRRNQAGKAEYSMDADMRLVRDLVAGTVKESKHFVREEFYAGVEIVGILKDPLAYLENTLGVKVRLDASGEIEITPMAKTSPEQIDLARVIPKNKRCRPILLLQLKEGHASTKDLHKRGLITGWGSGYKLVKLGPSTEGSGGHGQRG